MNVMYNKITTESINAFLNGKDYYKDNMSVTKLDDGVTYMRLWGNPIAKMKSDGTISISTCGWHTRTTLMRLNGLLYALGSTSRLRMKKFEPFLETKHGLLPWFDDLMVRYKQNTKLY
jgi:hypothetical protein